MATFLSRVEALSGTTINSDQVSWWLTAGTRILANLIPDYELQRYAAKIAITETGTTISDGYIFTATKGGYRAKLISANQAYALDRRDSIYYPSDKMPILLIEGTTAKMYPGGGDIFMLPVYVVLHNDEAIAQFPDELEPGVVLYACIANKTSQMAALMSTIQVLYTDAVSAAISATTIASIPTPPSYSPPSAPTLILFEDTAPNAPTISDLTIALTPPEPPEIDPFEYSEDISAPSPVVLLDATATAPDPPDITAYTPAAISPPSAPTITAFEFSENVEIPVFDPLALPEPPSFSAITIPGTVAIPDLLSTTTGILFEEASSVGISVESIGDISTGAPTYTPVNPSILFTSFTTRAGQDDVEMAQLYLAEIDRKLQEWRQDVEEELNEFNSEYQVWRTNAEKAFEQARLTLQQKIQDAQAKDNIDQFNELKKFEETLEEFRAQLQIHQANVARYVQYVNTQVNLATANASNEVQVYSAEVRSLIDVFQAEMQGFSTLVGAEIQAYRAEIEGLSQNFSNEVTLYTTRLRTDLEQWAQEMQTLAQVYNAEVSGYAAEVGAASDHNNARTSRFQAEIQKYVAQVEKELRGWQGNAETLLSSYRTQMDGYATNVNSLVQIYSTNTSARVQVYQAQMQGFQVESGVVAERNQSALSKYGQDMQNAINVMQTSNINFQAQVQRNIEQARITAQEAAQQAAQDTQVSTTNEAATLQAKIAEYQIKLERLNSMSAELQALIAQYQEVVTRYMMRHYPQLFSGAQR